MRKPYLWETSGCRFEFYVEPTPCGWSAVVREEGCVVAYCQHAHPSVEGAGVCAGFLAEGVMIARSTKGDTNDG